MRANPKVISVRVRSGEQGLVSYPTEPDARLREVDYERWWKLRRRYLLWQAWCYQRRQVRFEAKATSP
jgi:hypothetical protein